MVIHNDAFLSFFRTSSPYIHAYRGKSVVIYINGESLQQDGLELAHDLALLRSLGLKIVVVFGARAQINQALAQNNLPSEFHQGLRITTPEILDVVLGASYRLLAQLQAELSTGLVNSPMHGANVRTVSGNFIAAMPQGVLSGVDLQWTGAVRRVDAAAIRAQLELGHLVLIPPVGGSVTGELFNLNATEVAVATAQAIAADKLIFLDDLQALIANDIPVHGQALEQVLATQAPHHPTYAAALQAYQLGIPRVHLLQQSQPGALLIELYTRDGCGWMLSADPYDAMRWATSDDIGGILALLAPLEENGVLVRRSREQIELCIEDFVINERDGMVIGCAALHRFANTTQAELACLAVHPDYQDHGRGARLLSEIEHRARNHGVQELFALTTQTTHWFREHGFIEGNRSQLPEPKQSLYNLQRNSKIMIKPLQ